MSHRTSDAHDFDLDGPPAELLAPAEIARALGAEHMGEVDWGDDVPEELSELAARVQAELVSTGGRPTHPDRSLSRRVAFKPDVWQTLQNLSDAMGPSVAASHIAATIVEDHITALDAAIRRGAPYDDGKHQSDATPR